MTNDFYGAILGRFTLRIRKLLTHPDVSSGSPTKIDLPCGKLTLQFEVFSSVEVFRIANYGGEREFLERFMESLESNDVVFDIGASVGLFTVHAAACLGNGEVIAFEPDPETAKRLKHNVQLNSFSNVRYVSWAVSDISGEAVLFSDGVSGYAPTLREQKNRPGAAKGQVKVLTRALDEAIMSGDLPLPTVLKIDIEGAEVLCLRGALKLVRGELGAKPRLIFLEIHPDFLPSFNSSIEEVHSFVLNHGYSVVWQEKRDTQIHYCYRRN